MPSDLPIVQTYKAVIAAFPGAPTPADVVVRGAERPQPRVLPAAIRRTSSSAAVATGQMFPPILVTVSPDDTVADIQIPIAGNGDDRPRSRRWPPCATSCCRRRSASSADVQYAVAGETAGTHDFNQQMKSRMPWVIAFVLAPRLRAAARDVPLDRDPADGDRAQPALGRRRLRVARPRSSSTTGQRAILGFTSNHAITSWLPMFLFVVLFGLSMDYHVFILSRIKELRDGGLSTEEAVSRGIRRTAGTVTSAAIIMVAVFAIFGTLRLIMMKQLGVGLALAVLIDATVIRGVLLPATMKLLGEWNWYMPRWLEWLPSLTPEAREARRPRGRIVTN